MLVGAIRIATVWRLRCQTMLSTLVNRIVSTLKRNRLSRLRKNNRHAFASEALQSPFMIAPTPPPSPDNDYGRIIELLVHTGARVTKSATYNGPKSIWKPD